jgi:cytochrome c oxidase subunit 3
MSPDNALLTPEEEDELKLTAFERHRLEEQYANLEQQHEVAALGMWVFLATEVMFFGTLFLGVIVYRFQYPEAFEHASAKLNWVIGGINTVVLLVSSLFMVLGVHYAKLGQARASAVCLYLTAALGFVFLGLKGTEYYGDFLDKLVPGTPYFDPADWGDEAPHVQLFLIFYWVMTGLHALHVTLGIIAVLVMAVMTQRGFFAPEYYSPVDVTALYWHFVDMVWIFLLPTLYLLGTHTLADLKFL